MSEKSKVLITGATGRIGQTLMEGLEESFTLTGTSRSPNDDPRFIQLDYKEPEKVCLAFSKQDTVIHLHGNASNSYDSLGEYLQPNIVDVYTTYEAARQAGVQRIIFASSNHATGWTEIAGERAAADLMFRPDGIYGAAKIWGEALGSYFSDRFGLEVICLRIGSYDHGCSPVDFDMGPRILSTWLSDRDLIQLVRKALSAQGVKFGIYYGISNNSRSYWDITNASSELGYHPQDNAEDYADGVMEQGGEYQMWGHESWHTTR